MIYVGNPCPEVRTREGWSRQSGFYTEKEWEGPRDSMYGLAGEIQTGNNPPDSYDIEFTGQRWRLRARFSRQQGDGNVEAPVDEIRVHATVKEDDIYRLPRYKDVPNEDLLLIKFSIENPTHPKAIEAFSDDLTEELFNLMKTGQSHFRVFVPVLERRRIASSTFDFNATSSGAYVNVGSIISVASITADAALPNPRLFTLPAGGAAVEIQGGLIYNYGWLKNYPEYSQSAGNKAVLSQTWEYGLWSEAIYGVPI